MRDIKSFPTQKLSMFKKTQSWKEACVDYIIGSGSVGMGAQTRNRQGEMQELYDLYNGIYDEKNLKHVTNPFKQADQFPATAQDYNIIKPKVDVLLGEETKRPFNFKVCRTSDIATGEIQETAKKMLEDYLMATFMSKLSPENQQRYQEALASGEIQQPEAIAKYITKDYKDIAESAAHHTLNYLKLKLNLTHEFYKGWEHALIGGEECYYVGIRNGEPFVECRNPMRITYETFDGMEFIHEAAWCCYEMDMSATEIYDNFYDKMTEKQLNELLELIEDKPGGRSARLGKSSLDYNHIEIRNRNTLTDNPFDADHIKVWHCCWKSFKKIGFVGIMNPETEEIEEYQVDENYKETGLEESVEWKWIIEIWEGYRIGKDMYLGIQPLEYQHVSMENPNAQKLPYTGAVYNNLNTKPRSLVSIMKPLQYMYIILWYRLELAIARDKGKVAVMDVTQIPKNMGIDVNKWMHYLSALGVAFVNPYECFDPNTMVLTADGRRKKIKELVVGDCVMGPDGMPRKVLATHSGVDHMYKLNVLTGGNDQVVNSKHKIYYKEKDYHKKTEYTKLATPVDLIAEDADANYKKNLRYLQRAKDVDGAWNNEVLLDPYILGLWLGDGSTGKAEFTSEDREIIKALVDFADLNGMVARVSSLPNSNALNIRLANKSNLTKNGDNSPNILKESLRYYGILDTKKIPDAYIYTTRENRLQLLAGLIDTDGCYSKRDGVYTFSQCESRRHLVEDLAFVARSLGFKCTISEYKTAGKKYILKNENLSVCENTVCLRILDGELTIPTKIARKQGSVKKTKGSSLQSNFKVTYNGIGEYCGITVDEDNLFLLDDFTIVHNCGWDIPGREGGRPSQFNQMQAWDLSMSNVIAQYIQLMDKIEDMLAQLTGITPQRQGAISSSELVGNVERSVIQSSHITEPWFWVHNQVKKQVLTMLLDTAKFAWKGNKKSLHYVLDDATRAFINLSDQFFNEDMDVFVDDSTKENQQIEMLRNLMQPAMQNGASLLDIAEIITLDNVNLIKQRLQDIEEKRMQQMQEQQQREQEMQMQLQQAENEAKEEELMLKEAELDLQKYKIDQDNATKITVAQLNAYRGSENMDQNGNGIPDPIEIAHEALEERKQASDEASKQFELNNKRRELEMKREMENKQIELERERMQHEMKLQKAKDDAAMQREKLKARTAIRNKVVGESKKKRS